MKTWLWMAAAGLALVPPTDAAPSKIAFTSNRDGNQELYVMNPDGTSQTRLSNTPEVSEEFPGWSPDGSKIGFNRLNEIWTINPDGTGATAILIGNGGERRDAGFKPGTNLISFSRWDGANWIFKTADMNGSNEVSIFNRTYGPYAPKWSPDGKKLVYHAFNPFGYYEPRIYLRNADGSDEITLTPDNGNSETNWSPDGARIVFQSRRDGNSEIYVMNANGSNQVRLTNNSFNDYQPAFSPDGSKIAFTSERDGNLEIYVMNADGTGQTRLTNSPGNDTYPQWQQQLPANAPTVSIGDATIAEGNAGGVNATFTVTLSVAATTPVVLTYRTYDGTAKAGSDYTAVGPTALTFAPGETSKTISVPVLGDTIDEVDETFSIRFSADGAKIGKQEGIGTITDDDAVPSLSINDVSLEEGNTGNTGNTNAVFTVSLSSVSDKLVTVAYRTTEGTARDASYGNSPQDVPGNDPSGGDYNTTTGYLAIQPGQSSAAINIPVRGDTILEDDEQFTVELFAYGSVPVNATLADAQGVGTIVNDDSFPGVTISDVTVAEGATASFTVTLSKASDVPTTVNFATANGSATAGTDFTSKTGSVTIPVGQTTATITVATLNDADLESNESFVVNLSNPVNAVLSDAQGIGTITSDDLPELFISDVTIREGNKGDRTLTFNVALSEPAPFVVKANYATADGVATAGSDYTSTSGIVSFAGGEVSKSINVAIKGDTLYESDEVFFVNLSSPVSATLAVAQGKGTLINDEVAPRFSINDVSIVEGQSGAKNAVFTVSLSPTSEAAAAVVATTANGTAASGSDYTASSATVTFAAGESSKTFSVPVNGDQISEADETFLVNLTSATGNSVTLGDTQGVGTIVNDDFAPVNESVTHPGGSNASSSAIGVERSLTAVYSDANSVGDIRTARIVICPGAVTTLNSLSGYYDAPANKLYLHTGTSGGTLQGGFAPGSNNTITNAFGTLNCAQTTVTRSGNTLTIKWSFTPSASFIGAKNLYLLVSDLAHTDGWDDLGDWTVTSAAAAAIRPSRSVN